MGSWNTLIIVKNQRDIFSKFSMVNYAYMVKVNGCLRALVDELLLKPFYEKIKE